MIAALRGFVLSAVAATIVASIGFTLVAVAGGADGCCAIGFNADTGEALFSQVIFFGPFAVVGVAILALPLTFLLKKFRLEQIWSYAALGFATGYAFGFLALPGVAAWSGPYGRVLLGLWLLSNSSFGFAGAAGGAVWWLAYRKHRASSDAYESLV